MKQCLKYLAYLLVSLCCMSARSNSYSDFLQAIVRDDASAIQALLARGIDPNTRDPKGQPGLTLALQRESLRAADAIARHPQLEVDATNEAGETALMMAALKGELGWVQRLLERGAKVHQPGWSAIHYAATGPNERIVELLLARGAPIDAEAPNRSTPLMMAARYGSEASVKRLLAAGADVRRRNERGLSAADFARGAGRDSLAAELDRLAR